jgi:hypothetical protein
VLRAAHGNVKVSDAHRARNQGRCPLEPVAA